jgi:hypothetical protein
MDPMFNEGKSLVAIAIVCVVYWLFIISFIVALVAEDKSRKKKDK